MAAYGVDVLDPGVSLRRVHVLLRRLPPHYRRGGQQWSTESELLAYLIDHVANLTWVTLKANGAKNAPRPKPVPRPDGPHRAARGRGGGPRHNHPGGGGQPVKASSWADAAKALAAVPGVAVDNG